MNALGTATPLRPASGITAPSLGVAPQPASRLVRVLQPLPRRAAAVPLPRARGLREVLRAWWRRARERRELAAMSPRERADIGITRAEAQAEARKRFWQP